MYDNVSQEVKDAFKAKFLEIAKWMKSIATHPIRYAGTIKVSVEGDTIFVKLGQEKDELYIGLHAEENDLCFWSNGSVCYSYSRCGSKDDIWIGGKAYENGMVILRNWDLFSKALRDELTINKEDLNLINSVRVGCDTNHKAQRTIKRINID